nr:hypothetical protein [uncultured Marinifilum sp.]
MENILSKIRGSARMRRLAVNVKPGFLLSAIGSIGLVPSHNIRTK